MQIASITTNEQGEYEYATEEDYLEQTLDIIIQKEGFEKKNISYEIDKAEIKSDILLNELEITIKGKICDDTDSPLDNASVSFSIGGSTIDLVSDKDGSFSFTVGQQFLNQTIGYEVNKEGFNSKSGKLKLLENLECINLSKSIPPKAPDKSKWIQIAVRIGLIGLTVLVIYLLFGLPSTQKLSIEPDQINFNFEPETQAQELSIWNSASSFWNFRRGTLEWEVNSDQDWIMVSPDSGTESGTVYVNVNTADLEPGDYSGTITIESNGGTKTGTISLHIPEKEEPPEIHYFIADPENIDGPEGETTLSWEVSGATTVTIDGVGPVGVSKDSIDRRIEQTTTFTLRATNDAGVSDVKETTVYVNTVDPPVIHYFIANPEIISKGEKSTLRWDVSGVETVTIDNKIGKMSGIGNTDVFLDETTIFILTAENEGGKDVKTVTVAVEEITPELPIIRSFDAKPPSISPDKQSTLFWTVSGATSVTIDGIGVNPVSGEKVVYPDITTTYELIATNEAGKADSTVTVAVEELPPKLFVDPDPPSFDFKLGTNLNVIGANTRTFSVDNSGGGNLYWEIYTTEKWITIEPTRGVNFETVTITILTGLDPGAYSGKIYIESDYGTTQGDIYLNLIDNSPRVNPTIEPIIVQTFSRIVR